MPAPAAAETERNSGRMQQAGADDESETEDERMLSRRQLGAVSMTVQQSEEGDNRHRELERRTIPEQYGRAEDHRGECDAGFDARQWNAAEADKPAHRHEEWKRERQSANRRRPELRRPDPDRDHRKDMVPSRQGMHEPDEESVMAAMGNMSLGKLREQERRR